MSEKKGSKQGKLAVLKSRGQNFLTDKNIIAKIVAAAELDSQDTVFEIGPGEGALTRPLASAAKQVIAVEIDRGRARRLSEAISENVHVHHEDILKSNLRKLNLVDGEFIVVANLPFNVGTAVIQKLLSDSIRPQRLIVVLQAEVADRIVARGGKESILSLSVQLYGRVQKLFAIPRQAFRPQPRVEAAVVKITVDLESKLNNEQKKAILGLIKAGFSAKRKILVRNLYEKKKIPIDKAKKALQTLGKTPLVRAEDLRLQDWVQLREQLDLA